jgi:hypothetical protein
MRVWTVCGSRPPRRVRFRLPTGVCLVFAGIAGCTPAGDGAGEAAEARGTDLVAEAAPAVSLDRPPGPQAAHAQVREQAPVDDFEAQPKMLQLQREIPDHTGWQPGTTPWRRLEQGLPSQLMRNALAELYSPAAVVHGVLGLLGPSGGTEEGIWEQTIRIRRDDDDRATAVVLQWGGGDDSLSGYDLRMTIRRADQGWWYTEVIEERFHCLRGVTAEGVCA